MSLAELTRNCFQSGVSSSKWIGLCKLLISKEHALGSDTIESNLSNSVLVLYRFYPGDPDLQDYIKAAIQDGLLSIAAFVATLLQAARSPELHTSATLDTLCRVALEAHYSSGLPPVGSVVQYGESPITILGTVQDALALLRTAHSLPMSQFHQLTTSASELLILLLSCVSDISQVSTAQAMVHFADTNDLLQNFRLEPDVRQVLETFLLSLSLLIGDDAKAAREAQIMHTIQLALGKGDILGPSSDTDIVTFSLVFRQLVSYRAHSFGSGDEVCPAALLVGLFRWTTWTPTVFYTQLFLSAFTCLSQSSSNALLWKTFIVGRLPYLLTTFESGVNADGVDASDWRHATRTALLTAFQRRDLITQCEHAIARVQKSTISQDEDSQKSLYRDLLHQMIHLELINHSFAMEVDPLIANDNTPRLQADAQDVGLDLESYLETRLFPEGNLEDFALLIDRIWKDVGSHKAFANVAMKRFTALAGIYDVEALGHLCKMLFTYEAALDVIAMHVKVSTFIFRALMFLEKYDCETVGDPQTAVSHLGDVVLFVQYTTSRFHLDAGKFTMEGQTLSTSFLDSTDTIHSAENLPVEDSTTFNSWFKALFDSSSEGIEDTILRSTQPKTLLRISASLFSQAIKAHLVQKIDGDTLNNGVSFFIGPLLSWTLVGIIKAVVREIQEHGYMASIHFSILETLVLSPLCPQPVLSICGPRILQAVGNRRQKTKNPPPNIDVASVRAVVSSAIGIKNEELHSRAMSILAEVGPRQLVQNAFALARLGNAPFIDVERCIKSMPPSKFLQLLWSELLASASLGEMENCRRIATFVLTMPRSSNAPPLLPIFLHSVLPSIIAEVDEQPGEHTMIVELLVTVVSSVLTAALHLELAMRSVAKKHDFVLGQPSTTMARRFATDLRERKTGHSSRAIAQRLASSQSFVANFPVFMGEM
ncbi:mediator complex subunit Med5-domain-containing protein [Collybia nuda]|uniref:Mediator of RNA polymerase II transcription subunit 5 n=1 Tax=Collybia nuda TaxID=64659 RepID=A0A9P5Y441_9AGAR|nr:mediator complex subunit Med5-domain-containing protein [Collybia nuda]